MKKRLKILPRSSSVSTRYLNNEATRPEVRLQKADERETGKLTVFGEYK